MLLVTHDFLAENNNDSYQSDTASNDDSSVEFLEYKELNEQQQNYENELDHDYDMSDGSVEIPKKHDSSVVTIGSSTLNQPVELIDLTEDDPEEVLITGEAATAEPHNELAPSENHHPSDRPASHQIVRANGFPSYNQPVPLMEGMSHGNNGGIDLNLLSKVANNLRRQILRAEEDLVIKAKRRSKLTNDREKFSSELQRLSLLNVEPEFIASLRDKISTVTAKFDDYNNRIDNLVEFAREKLLQIEQWKGFVSLIYSQPVYASEVLQKTREREQEKARLEVYGRTVQQNISAYGYQPPPTYDQYEPGAPIEDDVDLGELLENIQPEQELSADVIDTPKQLNIKLLPHQRLGLEWLLKMEHKTAKGGILADDMGLGKTVQAISLILSNPGKPTLIVTPVALLRQWQSEINNKIHRGHQLKVFIYHSSKKASSFRDLTRYDVVLTSYGTLSSEYKNHFSAALKEAAQTKNSSLLVDYNSGGRTYKSPFFDKTTKFHRIVLDEAHLIKNKLTLASKSCALVQADYRLCLSGTPMQNNVDELYPLIRFLRIKPYLEEAKFRTEIAIPIKKSLKGDRDQDNSEAFTKLQILLKAILLRRTKNSKINNRPILQLTERIVSKDLISQPVEESEFYDALSMKVQKAAKKLLDQEKIGNYSSVLTLLLRLRQACDHSFLVRIGDILSSEEVETQEQNKGGENLSAAIEKCRKFSPVVQQEIEENLRKGEVACPLCCELLIAENTLVIYPCGDTLCSECLETFYQNFEVDENYRCCSCSNTVKKEDIIAYKIFDKVVNQHMDEFLISNSSQKLVRFSAKNKKQEIIKELLRAQGDRLNPSGKMIRSMELIKGIFKRSVDDKIIIFSQFTTFFDLFEVLLKNENIEFLRYDGSMTMDQRNDTVNEFYDKASKRVLLISLKAGNVGLTLTCASHVILVDPFWNPYVEEQAMDRVHRIGQLKTVYVYRLLIKGTVEDRIMELQERKKQVVEGALSEKGFKKISSLGRRELRYLFGIGGLGN